MKTFAEEDFLQLSALQHYSFCKRQWGLIHLEQVWSENILTAEGTQLHQRAHSPQSTALPNGGFVERDMRIRSQILGLSGSTDVVEFLAMPDGFPVVGRAGRYRIHPVEYKHGASKTIQCDRIQLCAQAICLEEMLGCTISDGDLYYGQTKRREQVLFDCALRADTAALCEQIHAAMEKGEVPPAEKGQKCRGCSLFNDCMPKMDAARVRHYWESVWAELEKSVCES